MSLYDDEIIDEHDHLSQIAKRFPSTLTQLSASAESILSIAKKIASDYNQAIYALTKRRGLPTLYMKPMPTVRFGRLPLESRSRIYWRTGHYIPASKRKADEARKFNYVDISIPKSGTYKEINFRKSFSTHSEEYMPLTLEAEFKLSKLREMLDVVKKTNREHRKIVSSSIELAGLIGLDIDSIKNDFGYTDHLEQEESHDV